MAANCGRRHAGTAWEGSVSESMEQEFILEQEEARQIPRPPAGRPTVPTRPQRPRPRPRPRPFPSPVAVVPTVAPADAPPTAARGCGTLLVLNGFTPEQTRLGPQHYSDLLQAALLLGRVRGSVAVEVVSRGGNGGALATVARARGEEVRRQLSFCLGLAGVRRGIRVSTPTGSGPAIELRVCVE
jgi:hypothetical protein